MKASQVPRIMDFLRHVWFGLALMLLLTFVFRITGLTASRYGAMAAALMFLGLTLLVISAIVFATPRSDGGQTPRY